MRCAVAGLKLQRTLKMPISVIEHAGILISGCNGAMVLGSLRERKRRERRRQHTVRWTLLSAAELAFVLGID